VHESSWTWIFVRYHRLARGLDGGAAGLKHRHGRARPHDHAHRYALGHLGQQFLDGGCLARAGVEVRFEMPGTHVDVPLRALDRLGHPWERVGAVDQHLHRIPGARGHRGLRPQTLGGGHQGTELSVPLQAAHMVVDHRVLDPAPDGGVDPIESSHWTPRTR